MKKAKKFLSLALASTLAAGLMASCGSTSSSTGATPSAADPATQQTTASADGEKTVLTFWHTWGAGPGLDALESIVKKYNETNTINVEIKCDFVASRSSGNTNTMDKLMAAVSAGTPPEIALLDNFLVPSWAAQDALVNLDTLGMDYAKVYDWLVEAGSFKGGHYSVPFNTDTRALFYNKDLFEAAGLDPEKGPSTIAELEEMAEKLTIKDGNSFKQVGFVPWQFAGRPIYTWGWSFGGDFYDPSSSTLTLDDPKIAQAVNWEVEYSKKYGGVSFVEYVSGFGTGAEDPFVTGQLAMAVRGNFDIANMAVYNPDLNYGIVPIPSFEPGKNITWAGGWGLTIPKGAAHQEKSLDFIKFCISEDIQRENATVSTNLSVIQGVNESLWGDDPLYDAFMSTLPSAHIRPPVPVGQELWSGLITVLEDSLYQKGDPAELLNKLNETMNAELDKFK